jgi:hypothetical protein
VLLPTGGATGPHATAVVPSPSPVIRRSPDGPGHPDPCPAVVSGSRVNPPGQLGGAGSVGCVQAAPPV